jgi:prepilin-type N-terminal cleavage/methylation domain-containing protein
MKHKKLAEGGFTLVEILVCIVVAAVITVSLNQVVNSYIGITKKGRYMNSANSYIEAKVEALRNSGYNSLTNGTTSLTPELSTTLPRSRSAFMTVTSPSAGLKKVDLTVSYNEQGQTTSLNYTTYLGELGVGQ